MSKKNEKSSADLERLAREKISAIRRVVLENVSQGGSITESGIRSREIELVVLESLRVRKALKRVRRTEARRLRKAGGAG